MRVVAFAVICLTLLASCGGRCGARADAEAPADSDSVWADSVLRTLSVERRVGQLFMPAVYARADSATLVAVRRYGSEYGVGGVLMLRGDIEGAVAVRNAAVAASDVCPWVAIDAEWGLGMRLDGLPVFPANGSIGAGADSRTMYIYGSEVAREARVLGINMVLGPVLDAPAGVKASIGSRAFRGDVARVGELGTSYAEGLERGGVMSVAKHFPGLGSVGADTHRELGVVPVSLARLDTCDLEPFRQYVEAGLSGVMVGHLAVPAVDYVRRPATLSPVVISDLLRGDLRFGGLVLTDALNMGGNTEGDFGAVAALSAGADVILAPEDTRKAIDDVVAAVRDGRLKQSRVDDACRRVLMYKRRFASRNAGLSASEARREILRRAVSADTLGRVLRGAPDRRSCSSRCR